MSTKSELKLPFIEFDYNDDTEYSSKFKEGILYMTRIQKVFDKLGEIDITPEVTSFFPEPALKLKLEEIVKTSIKLNLSSPQLPFLMRAELVDAYFHYRISQHLGQLDKIEIFLPSVLRDEISNPIGYEAIKKLETNWRLTKKGNLTEEIKEGVRKEILRGALRIYNIIFEGQDIDFSDFVRTYYLKDIQTMQNALVPVSSQLQESNFGGKDAINSILFFRALSLNTPLSEKGEAIINDNLRKVFQQDGKLPPLGDYNTFELSVNLYNLLPNPYKRFIHSYLIDNLMDAQQIRGADTIFQGGIEPSFAMGLTLDHLLGKAETGVTIKKINNKDAYVFDNEPSKDLDRVAAGAQYLINNFASLSNRSIVPLRTQPASEKRREDENVNIFNLFLSEAKFYQEDDLKKITASNAYEHYGIDNQKQTEFYNAYRRLFGDYGYEGGTGEEPWVKARIRLNHDGRMEMAIIDEMYGDKENIEWFDPLEYAKSKDEGVNFRKYYFDRNSDKLKELIEEEINHNNRIKQSLGIETNKVTPVKVDEGLYYQLFTISDTVDRLAKWDEMIVALLPFVQQDYSEYMEMLGITELVNKYQISQAFHKAVARDMAHPDKTNDPKEKIEKTVRLIELMNARDELFYKLDLEKLGGSTGVSTYIGNISQILKG